MGLSSLRSSDAWLNCDDQRTTLLWGSYSRTEVIANSEPAYDDFVSSRLDPSWLVLHSYEPFEANRCVDLFRRPDGTLGFEEFRRDPEDQGRWTPLQYFSHGVYDSEDAALEAACERVSWLREVLDA